MLLNCGKPTLESLLFLLSPWGKQIERSLSIEVLLIKPFVKYEGYIDLNRFSRYWRVAKRYVFD